MSGGRTGESVNALDFNIILDIFTRRDYQLGDQHIDLLRNHDCKYEVSSWVKISYLAVIEADQQLAEVTQPPPEDPPWGRIRGSGRGIASGWGGERDKALFRGFWSVESYLYPTYFQFLKNEKNEEVNM